MLQYVEITKFRVITLMSPAVLPTGVANQLFIHVENKTNRTPISEILKSGFLINR